MSSVTEPYCPAGSPFHPQYRSWCRSPQWWGHSLTQSRTVRHTKCYLQLSLQYITVTLSIMWTISQNRSVSTSKYRLYPTTLYENGHQLIVAKDEPDWKMMSTVCHSELISRNSTCRPANILVPRCIQRRVKTVTGCTASVAN